MKIHLVQDFFRQLTSIKDSTFRRIIAANKTIELDGLCSYYVSHRYMMVNHKFTKISADSNSAIAFQNKRFTLIFAEVGENLSDQIEGFQVFGLLSPEEAKAELATLLKDIPMGMKLGIDWSKLKVIWFRPSRLFIETETGYRTCEKPNFNFDLTAAENHAAICDKLEQFGKQIDEENNQPSQPDRNDNPERIEIE